MAISGTGAALLRGLLGALCVLFAYNVGRVWLRVARRGEPRSRAVTWTLRTLVAGLGLTWWRGLDAISIVFLGLAVASCSAGLYVETHPPKEEHLEDVMFPRE